MIGLIPAACLSAELLLSRSESTEQQLRARCQAAAVLSPFPSSCEPPREVCVVTKRVEAPYQAFTVRVKVYTRWHPQPRRPKRPMRDQASNPWASTR